jgi:two-component system response regulator AtoC
MERDAKLFSARGNNTLNSELFGQIKGLFESPVELPSLMDELSLGVVIMDLDRRILFLNSTFEILSGFSREEVWGVPCRDVLRANICQQGCPVVQAEKTNAPVSVEGNIINRSRQKIPIRLTTVPLSDVKGKEVGFLETVEDMRVFQQMADPLLQSDILGQFIGRSARMEKLLRLIPVVAQTDSSLLITGETGTGKDVLAEIIHKASDRAKAAFIKINCGALPETLLESELFGHKKGAFTGAVGDKMGRLRLAHNGTLYLTEIGDLPLPLQAKLLTFLDDKVVYPLGGTKGFQADVRVIAATHRDLEQMVKDGLFRQDLLFRLNVVRLHLPPLRERGGDIELLLDHFLKVFSGRFGKRIQGFFQPVKQCLLNYTYPGNVRELKNIVEYAANICQTESIGMEHLPAYLTDETLLSKSGRGLESRDPLSGSQEAHKGTSGMDWAAIERRLIVDTLLKVNGKRSKAAEILGWGRSTLWRKMKQHGLES